MALCRWIAAATAVLATVICAAAQDGRNVNRGRDYPVFRVLATCQENDPYMPWRKLRPYMRHGYGILVDEDLVLTTEILVRNHTLVELQRPLSPRKINTRVVLADPQINLALLHLARDGDTHPAAVPIADRVRPNDRFQILELDMAQQVRQSHARVREVSMEQLPAAPNRVLAFSLLCDASVEGQGSPALVDGKLGGLIFNYRGGNRTASLLPIQTIRRFLEAAGQETYPGMASAGFTWAQLVDPVKRRYLGMDEKTGGVLVTSRLPGSGADDVLKAGDVLLAWDGRELDNRGYYSDPDFGRIEFSHLIKGTRLPGDRVPVEIVRDKVHFKREVVLSRFRESDALIPENTENAPVDYIVDGGMIIRELTGRYLRAFGNDWVRSVDSRLANLYLTRRYAPEQPGQRVLILSSVLADPINIGYQHFRGQVIDTVNGQPVANMADVRRACQESGHIFRIGLRSVGVDIVLDRDQLDAANIRIARNYGLPLP